MEQGKINPVGNNGGRYVRMTGQFHGLIDQMLANAEDLIRSAHDVDQSSAFQVAQIRIAHDVVAAKLHDVAQAQ